MPVVCCVWVLGKTLLRRWSVSGGKPSLAQDHHLRSAICTVELGHASIVGPTFEPLRCMWAIYGLWGQSSAWELDLKTLFRRWSTTLWAMMLTAFVMLSEGTDVEDMTCKNKTGSNTYQWRNLPIICFFSQDMGWDSFYWNYLVQVWFMWLIQ